MRKWKVNIPLANATSFIHAQRYTDGPEKAGQVWEEYSSLSSPLVHAFSCLCILGVGRWGLEGARLHSAAGATERQFKLKEKGLN